MESVVDICVVVDNCKLVAQVVHLSYRLEEPGLTVNSLHDRPALTYKSLHSQFNAPSSYGLGGTMFEFTSQRLPSSNANSVLRQEKVSLHSVGRSATNGMFEFTSQRLPSNAASIIRREKVPLHSVGRLVADHECFSLSVLAPTVIHESPPLHELDIGVYKL